MKIAWWIGFVLFAALIVILIAHPATLEFAPDTWFGGTHLAEIVQDVPKGEMNG